MTRCLAFGLFGVGSIFGFGIQSVPATAESPDLSKRVENLGIPLAKKYPDGEWVYARNVWDLQAFRGLLFVGSGNSNNQGPAQNAAPAEVWGFDPRKNKFFSEGTLDECQLDRFRVIDGQLMTPGHDATEPWDLGNFYVRERDKWIKHRTVPGAIHVYDIYQFQKGFFAAIGANGKVPRSQTIMGSADGGKSWKPVIRSRGRIYSLFELNQVLYGASSRRVSVLKGRQFETLGPTRVWFANGEAEGGRIERPINFKGRLVYINADHTSDHQWFPTAGYVASHIDAPKVKIPVKGLPFDLIVSRNLCYVLACEPILTEKEALGRYWVRVYASADLSDWDLLCRFRADSFARSFERVHGDFYFGLGCHVRSLRESCGTILRLREKFVEDALEWLEVKECAKVARLGGSDSAKVETIERVLADVRYRSETASLSRSRNDFRRLRTLAFGALGVRKKEPVKLKLNRASIVPGADSLSVTLSSSASGSKRCGARALFFDPGGRVVRTIESTQSVGVVSVSWDGCDEDGKPVADGTYRLLASLLIERRPTFPIRSSVVVGSATER